MTSQAELLVDAFGRVKDAVHDALDGLSLDVALTRLDPDANSIGWLIWHLTRIQDDHVAGVAGIEQVWTSAGWAAAFDLPYDRAAHGYGQSSAEVGAFQIDSVELLAGYHGAVHDQTASYVRAIDSQELARVVDDSWDPPVTVAVRLISVVSDTLQHAGQAALIRGVAERSR